MPAITVLMPVFNAESYLKEAINSILNQTFSDFEFLIFDDGSTDSSKEIILSYRDRRIIFHNHNKNIGYVHHLNKGIKSANGKYIARMDADDISDNRRFEYQISFMEGNPEVVLCGTRFKNFGLSKNLVNLPCSDEDIRLAMLNNNVIAHPSVMIKTEALHKNNLIYQEIPVIEDYALWINLADFGAVANLPNYLLHYRDGIGVSSKTFSHELLQLNYKLRLEYALKLFSGSNLSYEEIEKLSFYLNRNKLNCITHLIEFKQIIHKIIASFSHSAITSTKMSEFLKHHFFYLCTMSTHIGPGLFFFYIASGLPKSSFSLNLKMALKSLVYFNLVNTKIKNI